MIEKENYQKLQKIFRKELQKELRSNKNYNNLRNPNRKIKIPSDFENPILRAILFYNNPLKLTIMPRWPINSNGRRNLELGNLEIVLGLFGEFKNSLFILDKQKPYRVAKGFGIPDGFSEYYCESLSKTISSIKDNLKKQEYTETTKKLMKRTEDSRRYFKIFYKNQFPFLENYS
jgi:hypothetical protein